jgi:hypothetical protein
VSVADGLPPDPDAAGLIGPGLELELEDPELYLDQVLEVLTLEPAPPTTAELEELEDAELVAAADQELEQ